MLNPFHAFEPCCCCDAVPDMQAVKDRGLTLYSFDDFKKMGAEKPADPVPPSPEDLCTIMYTSGTTGKVLFCWCRDLYAMCISSCSDQTVVVSIVQTFWLAKGLAASSTPAFDALFCAFLVLMPE
eukprot:1141799-Pelagomonas_calceolata.AAC.1